MHSEGTNLLRLRPPLKLRLQTFDLFQEALVFPVRNSVSFIFRLHRGSTELALLIQIAW